MNCVTLALCLVLVAGQGAKVGEVETTVDKGADFSALRTYSWLRGYDAHDPAVHKMIVAAVEQEMAQRGFKRVDTAPDVTIAYYSGLSTEVDLKALDKLQREGLPGTPTKSLGRLVVMMRKGTSEQRLWTVSTREHVDPDPAKTEATVKAVVQRLFAEYPSKKRN